MTRPGSRAPLITWTPPELASSARRYQRALWRVVEAQHTASTMRLADTLPAERQRIVRQRPEILITTPESLNLLVHSKAGPALFAGLPAQHLAHVCFRHRVGVRSTAQVKQDLSGFIGADFECPDVAFAGLVIEDVTNLGQQFNLATTFRKHVCGTDGVRLVGKVILVGTYAATHHLHSNLHAAVLPSRSID